MERMYLENLRIMQENEQLWKKAQLLDQENKALLAQLKLKHKHKHNHGMPSSAAASSTTQHPGAPSSGVSGGGTTAAANLKAAPSKSGKQPK